MDNFTVNKSNFSFFKPVLIFQHVLSKKVIKILFSNRKWDFEPVLETEDLAVDRYKSVSNFRAYVMHSLLILGKVETFVQNKVALGLGLPLTNFWVKLKLRFYSIH